MAAKAAPSALVVATRAADGGCGAGYGDPPFALQGGHRERRPFGDRSLAPAPRWVLPSILSSRRTMAGPTVGGERAAALLEPLASGGSCSGTQASGTKIVQSLDVPVLQIIEQLPNITQFFAAHLPVVAEPVIEVPKIFPDRVPQRLVEHRPPQKAEQLVEVPTEPVYVLIVLASKVFSRGELLGLLPGQG